MWKGQLLSNEFLLFDLNFKYFLLSHFKSSFMSHDVLLESCVSYNKSIEENDMWKLTWKFISKTMILYLLLTHWLGRLILIMNIPWRSFQIVASFLVPFSRSNMHFPYKYSFPIVFLVPHTLKTEVWILWPLRRISNMKERAQNKE